MGEENRVLVLAHLFLMELAGKDQPLYALDEEMAQYLAEALYQEAGEAVQYVEGMTTTVTIDKVMYPPTKYVPRDDLPQKRRLYVLTYDVDHTGMVGESPLYAFSSVGAQTVADDWLNEHPECSYRFLRPCSDGKAIAGCFYPGEKEVLFDA